MRIVITNGTVVTSTETIPADVLIEDEKVVALAAPGAHHWQEGADTVIDASGKYVVPGGVDIHTHFELPFGGTYVSDSFETGTRAAAFGGTTTVVDFAVQVKGESVRDGFEKWMQKAEGNCAIDYGFHMIVGDINDASLEEMSAIVDEGVTSFKLFMAYPGVLYSDDGEIFRAMQRAAGDGTTIMMHAENGIAIDVLREQALERGETDPKYHSITRPPTTESEAVYRAIVLAELAGAPLYIVHMSSKEAVVELTKARDRGLNVFGETCPQYLHLSVEDHVSLPGFEGAKYVCSPPIRFKEEGHQEYLWNALARGDLQVVSTDHACFFYDDDETLGRQKRLGEGNFTLIPNGLPGVEERFNVMYQSGVVGGRFDINRWVDLVATTPAKMFGMYPRKGTIAVGSDADIVVYDPHASFTYSAPDTIHGNIDYTCYEGMEINATIDHVLSRGKVIVEGGEYVGTKGHGQYLKRGMSQLLI
ncbi:D-hydantoinase [bacterium BMS3Abin02]|nr:D-hydantoinase [bacterium BMS3Abin02]GBE23133.1 D-hydantoinase [bacterium BMS3Bbin01]HDH25386.1 dihydropyrimidinase [Actinomycetota bacterium]HDK45138.1 dihydropyrimidinase [Actinomycetota bacterium]